MATGMHMDERSVDCLVLGHHDQDRKVSAKSVTMRAMTLCKNLSGYRELLLSVWGWIDWCITLLSAPGTENSSNARFTTCKETSLGCSLSVQCPE